MHFSILHRCDGSLFLKFPEEIAQIEVAAFQTDFHHRELCLFEKLPGLFDSVLIDVFHWRASDDFFEKSAEVLFIHIDLTRQIADVKLIFVIFLDVGEYDFDTFYLPVMVFLRGSKHPVFREKSENVQEVSPDIELPCRVIGDGPEIRRCVAATLSVKNAQDSGECLADRFISRMIRINTSGEMHLSAGERLNKPELRCVAGVKV